MVITILLGGWGNSPNLSNKKLKIYILINYGVPKYEYWHTGANVA